MAENPLAPDLHNPAQPAPAVQPQAPDVVMQDIPPQAAQPRAWRSHKDDLILSLLSSKLSLRDKLSKNKEIEDQNKNRKLRTFNHHVDSVVHLETGSENASFITIDESDLKDLKDPSILARFLNFVPEYLLLRITCENQAEKEEHEKRKLNKFNSSPSEPFLDAKRCRMDGSKVAECVIGSQLHIDFCWN